MLEINHFNRFFRSRKTILKKVKEIFLKTKEFFKKVKEFFPKVKEIFSKVKEFFSEKSFTLKNNAHTSRKISFAISHSRNNPTENNLSYFKKANNKIEKISYSNPNWQTFHRNSITKPAGSSEGQKGQQNIGF